MYKAIKNFVFIQEYNVSCYCFIIIGVHELYSRSFNHFFNNQETTPNINWSIHLIVYYSILKVKLKKVTVN